MTTSATTQALYLEDETIATGGLLAMAQGQEHINTVPMMELPYHMYTNVPFVAPMLASPYDDNATPVLPIETENVSKQYLHILQQLASLAIAECDKVVIDEIFSHMYE